MTPSEHAALSKIVVIAIGAWEEEIRRQYRELNRVTHEYGVGLEPYFPIEATYVTFTEKGKEWPYTFSGMVWHREDLSDLSGGLLEAVIEARARAVATTEQKLTGGPLKDE